MRILSKLNLSLCLLCAGLGYFLYQQTLQPAERVQRLEASASAQAGAVRQEPAQKMAPMPARSQFSQFIERPPFSATRRPPQPRRTAVVAKPQPQPMPKPRIVLVGTFVNSVSGVAVIQWLGTDKQLRLSLGESLDGWTLESIQRDRILLRSKSETFEVLLRASGSSNRR